MKKTNYQYRVNNHPYSGYFKTKRKAIKWYNNHGKKLAKMFNRELVLTENNRQESDKLDQI